MTLITKDLRSKKIILVIGLLLFLIFTLWLFVTHSILILNSQGREEINVALSAKSGYQNQFKIKNSSKFILLPKGSYSLEVSGSEGKLTSYSRRLSMPIHRINLELKPQMQSYSLGYSSFTCSRSSNPAIITYYPCKNYQGLIEVKKSDRPSSFVTDPLHKSKFSSSEETGGSAVENNNPNHSSVLKPYGDNFLSLVLKGGTITSAVLDSGGKIVEGPYRILSGYNQPLSDALVSVVDSRNSKIIGLIDPKGDTLYRFSGPSDLNPIKLHMPGRLSNTSYAQSVTLNLSEKTAYILISKDLSASDSHGEDKEELETLTKASKEQRVLRLSLDNNQLDDLSLPDDTVIQASSVSSEGNLLLVPNALVPDSQVMMLAQNSNIKPLDIHSNNVREACWLDNETIIFTDKRSTKLFGYSMTQKASYLLYENLKYNLSFLNCSLGTVSFVSQDKKDVLDHFLHYKLSSDAQTGVRIDTELPFYYTFRSDTYKVESFQNGISVSLDYDSDHNGPSKKSVVTREIKRLLEEKGIVMDGLSIDYRF